MSNAEILGSTDFTHTFYVQTDASHATIGAASLQGFDGPALASIEFASRKLHKNELNWHTSDEELVAVAFAMNKWIRYLLSNHFPAFVDHLSLKELIKHGREKRQRLYRWLMMLQQSDFTAKHLPGDKNFIADYLSRYVIPNNENKFIDQHQLPNPRIVRS